MYYGLQTFDSQAACQAVLPPAATSAPVITTTSLPNGTVGASYSASIAGSGGTGSYSWSATGLPAGLGLIVPTIMCADSSASFAASCTNQLPAIIGGTPTAAGTYNVTVQIQTGDKSNWQTVYKQFTLVIAAAGTPAITVVSPNGGETLTVGQPTTITWNTTGFSSSDTVSISLYNSAIQCQSNSSGGLISFSSGCWTTFPIVWSGVKNTGSYTWDTNTYFGDPGPNNPLHLSQNISNGSVYKINISITGSNGVTTTDSSNNYFGIVPALPFCAQPPMPTCPSGLACIQFMPSPKTYTSYDTFNSDKATYLYAGNCR